MIEELNGDFLQWLRGFYYVARSGSVRKAARLMNRNPSTISYQPRCLEEELRVTLFDRVKRSLRITDEGRELLAWTISAFETLNALKFSVSNSGGKLKGRIRMAGTLPMLKLAVPAIADFRRDFPKVDIFIEREIAINIRRLADDSEIDFGLMPALKPIAGLEVLFSSKPWLIYPESSDFRVPCNPSLADLAGLRFITFKSRQRYEDLGYYDKNSGLGEVIANNSVLSVNNNEMMLHFIACGVGVGIMDEHCFKAHTERKFATNLKSVDIGSLLPDRLYGIYSRPGKKMSPQSVELIRR